jgi:hypothetical protein
VVSWSSWINDPSNLPSASTFILHSIDVESLHDPPSAEIIRRAFHNDPVPRKNPNSVNTHAAGNVRKHFMSSVHLYAEDGVRECFPNSTSKLDRVLTSHPRCCRCWSVFSLPRRVKTPDLQAHASHFPSANAAHPRSPGYGLPVAYPSACGTESQDVRKHKTPPDDRQGPVLRAGMSTRRI